MDPSRIEQVAELFEAALEKSAPDRAAFLDQACGADAELRKELDSLLESHESANDFFDGLSENAIRPAYDALSDPEGPTADAGLLPRLQQALGAAYNVERELGGGGMSRVFIAEEVKLRRKVVIKVLPSELAASVSADRFRREIHLVAQLQHPHIVPLFNSDSTDLLVWYSMPVVAGESLRARLARDGPLPVAEARKIWRDVLDALAYAHSSGVVHRDIKPANILVSGRNALVADFGIARAIENAAGDADDTAAGLAIGTPAYMAPEQANADQRVDHRADIYSAALVMYEMLDGRRPFEGRSGREQMLARLSRDAPPVTRPDCPEALRDLVGRCLATNPATRPATAETALAELDLITAAGTTRGPKPREWRRLAGYGLLAAAAVAAVLIGANELGEEEVPASPAAFASPSIAVLPLRDLGTDPGEAALADGLTEELNATLSRTGNLRVIASTSVLALTNRQLDVRQIAATLGVSYVLEGGVQKIGDRLRMQARLVDAKDGSTRWAETFDREMGDIFAMQDDIARAVALAVNARFSESRGTANLRRYTPDIEAYEWYLRGMNTLLLRTDSGRRQGLEYFRRAIAADSAFAAAHAGMVWIYLGEGGSTPGNYSRVYQQALDAALEAVRLDDSLAQAQSALGWAHMAQQNLGQSEAALKRAVALDPAVYRGYEGLARTYMLMRRPAEQLTAARLGMEAAPFSHAAIREMSLALYVNGRCDEALDLLRPLKSLTPPAGVAGVIRGQCFAVKGMWPEAIAEFRWATETTGARAALGLMGHSLARSGRTQEARSILSDLLARRRDSHGAFGIAVIYAGLGDYDRAFKWLAQSQLESSSRIYIMGPLFADLHEDPRFAQLLNRRDW